MVAPAPIARALSLPQKGVGAVLQLLSDGNTVPFIARYRKEATGNLDEVAIERIQKEAARQKALDDRRATILEAIAGQGKLTDALRQQIEGADDAAVLEDLYLPYKQKRATRASKARDLGLEPLANQILAQPRSGRPQQDARRFCRDGVPDADAALAGARDIVAERIAERADVRARARSLCRRHGLIASGPKRGVKAEELDVFADYADHHEPLDRIPSHRYLAMCRGEDQDKLRVYLDIDRENLARALAPMVGYRHNTPYASELREALTDCVKRLLVPSLERELRNELRERAEDQATEVFAQNLEDLLLAPPFGQRPVVAIDPGFRTGCKAVALGPTGDVLAHTTVMLHTGRSSDAELARLLRFIDDHRPAAIAIGSGTAGRETEAAVRGGLSGRNSAPTVVLVSEAGASVYSASAIAREEFPDLDLTVRGAISIGRRLQDPLAELVKIDPAALGVGQYQHDLRATRLSTALDTTVSRCVNRVGVALNTASAPLLERVAGIGPSLAQRIVAHRSEHGPFRSRADLHTVKGLGARTFEQCAGFLRVRGGTHPLDASAVHPEHYATVERMARTLGTRVADLIGDEARIRQLDPSAWPDVGPHTLADIRAELLRPGRDPRAEFELPDFRDDLHSIEDLQRGMVLSGVVTNVAAFGAFVDLGVHCDGLVHVSKLARRRVSDPREVVRVGQVVQVEVLDVDVRRKRISLQRQEQGAPETAGRPR
jgi:uncharacterized protein